MAELGNVQQLKGMLQRLGAGEDLASVREDFVKSFKDVPVKDIMAAEQDEKAGSSSASGRPSDRLLYPREQCA